MATLRKTGKRRRKVNAARTEAPHPGEVATGLFLKEHREAQDMSADKLGEKLGIDRVSVYRIEKKGSLASATKQREWAKALGIRPEELWRHPDDPSLDRRIAEAPESIRTSIQLMLEEFRKK